VVFIRTVSHSGTQQKHCTFVCIRASSENKICSPQSVYLPISLTLPAARPADWTQRTAWQDRRPIQYDGRNSSRRMKLSSEAHSSNSSIQDQWQQGMFL